MLLSPTADKTKLRELLEERKWEFVAGLKPILREPLMQQLGMTTINLSQDKGPSWHKIVTMAQNIEATATLPLEIARVGIKGQVEQWKKQQSPATQVEQHKKGPTCWRCGGPHVRAECKFPQSIKCNTCGREGHMWKVCRQQKMMKSGG